MACARLLTNYKWAHAMRPYEKQFMPNSNLQNKTLIGPFAQILTLRNLPEAGPIKDDQLEIITNGAVLIEGERIVEVDDFEKLARKAKKEKIKIHEIENKQVLQPGLIDVHTHICYAGNRARDYALRVAGTSYLEIAKQGGGILDTVQKTRAATLEELKINTIKRATRHFFEGITTCEVKSGYGLTVEDELKMLRAIKAADQEMDIDLIPTCLAAHLCPKEFTSNKEYLELMASELLPIVKKENLSGRVDIFVEDSAFTPEEARPYLEAAKKLGFDIVIHADQFTTGGSALASDVHAISAEHLEVATERELKILKKAGVTCVALPGASLGLGVGFTPARKILDTGLKLVIASDWNPGSAPMGDLLMQACILGTYEKLTLAEILASLTIRAASNLKQNDRGSISSQQLADMISFSTTDYRDIFYHQGKLKPHTIIKKGKILLPNLI